MYSETVILHFGIVTRILWPVRGWMINSKKWRFCNSWINLVSLIEVKRVLYRIWAYLPELSDRVNITCFIIKVSDIIQKYFFEFCGWSSNERGRRVLEKCYVTLFGYVYLNFLWEENSQSEKDWNVTCGFESSVNSRPNSSKFTIH